MSFPWTLVCSNCDATRDAGGLPTLCLACKHPWLVEYATLPEPSARESLHARPWTMWRYREFLPLREGEDAVTMGEGGTPLIRASSVERSLGMKTVWIKDEGQNPCGSFKSRGLSAAVTRAARGGATALTLPTAGNAGVAISAYGARAGLDVRVYAPDFTPPTLLSQIRLYGADLRLIDGHIGICGQQARAYAEADGAFNVSTLCEPYRIEGKKTLGLELAEQLGWTLPDCILYPTGGGTGLIGMWKAFEELRRAGWITDRSPRLFSVQSTGCAPVVKAFEEGADATEPWPDPVTVASGLRVPSPLGGKLSLRAIRETGGGAVAVTDPELEDAAKRLAEREGLDACPEGGAVLAALEKLVARGDIRAHETVVLFNTGAGWLYR